MRGGDLLVDLAPQLPIAQVLEQPTTRHDDSDVVVELELFRG
jgi:hypothetical protein